MANKTITIPSNGNPGDTHVRNGDQVTWQSASAWTVDFTNTPFRATGGPQSFFVSQSNSPSAVVAGRPAPYPYSVTAGVGAGADPNIIVDPPEP